MRLRHEAETARDGVRRHLSLDIRRRRDDGVAAERGRELARQGVRAADVAGKQADDVFCLFIHDDDGRVGELAPDERRDAAHDDARGHEEDEGVIARKDVGRGRDDAGKCLDAREPVRHGTAARWGGAVRGGVPRRCVAPRRFVLRRQGVGRALGKVDVGVRQGLLDAPRRLCPLRCQREDGRPHLLAFR